MDKIMKNSTLLITLLSFGLCAQNFPSPYCDIDPTGVTVEEITSVEFAGTNIQNSDATSVLVDKTESLVLVTAGETFTIKVQGNTVGDFENKIVAFIDWNANEILDDTDEIYEVGTLINSNGTDGISVSADIIPPPNGVIAFVRARITKTYIDDDSPAEIDPCAIAFNPFGQGVFPGFGQALDFTVDTGTLGIDDFQETSFSLYPNPTSEILYINSSIARVKTITITDINGRIVQNSGNDSLNEIYVSNLQSGMYFLNVQTDQGTIVKRFVKK